jgi:hypothetical protein
LHRPSTTVQDLTGKLYAEIVGERQDTIMNVNSNGEPRSPDSAHKNRSISVKYGIEDRQITSKTCRW